MNDEYLIYGETLTAIADSIRSVSSVSTTWTPDEMAAYILENLVKPTTRQAAKTYTPSTSNQTIPAGTFLTGAATIQGDADWTEGNIKKGVNMWGKTGTLDGIFGAPGSLYGFTAVKSGTFTLTSRQNGYTVTHNLGIEPKLIIVYTENTPITNNSSYYTLHGIMTFRACSSTTLTAKKSYADGPFMMVKKSVSLSDDSYSKVEYAYSTPGSLYYGSSSSMSTRYGVSSTTTTIGLNGYIGPGTYKWLVMG